MTVSKLPDGIHPGSGSMHLKHNIATFQSAYNEISRHMDLMGERWVGELRFERMEAGDFRRLQAFIAAQRGPIGRFEVPWPDYQRNQGAATGVTVATVIDGRTLRLNCGVVNALAFAAGDLLVIGGEVKQVIQDARSDGTGQALVKFEPALRHIPSAGQPVSVDPITLTVRLANDQTGAMTYRQGVHADCTIKIEEAL